MFLLGSSPWYVIQYPGVLTWDSVDQLLQAGHQRPLNPWHSVPMTLVLRSIGPGLWVIFQWVGFAVGFAYALSLATSDFDAERPPRHGWVAGLVAFLAALTPTLGVYLSWIIKDVIFTVFALLGAVLHAGYLVHGRASTRRFYLMGLVPALGWLLRHDGIAFALLLVISTSVFRWKAVGRRGRTAMAAGLLTVAIALFATIRLSGARESPASRAGWTIPFVHDMAGILVKHGHLDSVDSRFLASFADVDALRSNFSPARGDIYYWRSKPNVDFSWLASHPLPFARGYLRMVLENPRLVIRLRLARLKYQLGLGDLDIMGDWKNCAYREFPLASQGRLVRKVRQWLLDSTRPPLRLVLWCSLWPLLMLLALACLAAKQRQWGVLLLAAVPPVYVLLFSIVSGGPVFRYNWFILPFLAVASVGWLGRARSFIEAHSANARVASARKVSSPFARE